MVEQVPESLLRDAEDKSGSVTPSFADMLRRMVTQ